MYSTIRFRTASKATPQGRHLSRAGVGVELAIKRLPARCLDHQATTSLIHIHRYIHIHKYMQKHIHTYTYISVYTSIYWRIHPYTLLYITIRMYTSINIDILTIYMHIHTQNYSICMYMYVYNGFSFLLSSNAQAGNQRT